MSIQHITMVLQAGGIGSTEKFVLLALCNYTTPKGFCFPGERRVADDTGMSLRTVQRAKAKLVEMGLLKSVRRVDRKTGEPLSNLSQVNLALLERMERPKASYDDLDATPSLFGDDDQPSDLLIRHIDGRVDEGDSDLQEEADIPCRQNDGRVPSDWRQGAVRLADYPSETPKGSLTPPPPSPSLVGGSVVAEDEEDLEAASGGEEHTHFEEQYTGEPEPEEAPEPEREDSLKIEVTEAHHHKARLLLGAIPWPRKNVGLGVKTKGEIMERLAVLAAGGWEPEDVRDYLSGGTDWSKVRYPSYFVLNKLNDAPEVIREVFVEAAPVKLSPEQKKLMELEAAHARLSAEREQQLIEVRLCADCDEGGWFWASGRPSVGSPSWHGHGKMGLITEVNRAGSAVAQYREAMEPDENLWELAPSGA